MLTYSEKVGVEGDLPDIRANQNLYLSIRNLLLEEVSNNVEKNMPAVTEIAARIRKELPFYMMSKRSPFQIVAGADAGSQLLYLASRRYAVISALVYSLPYGARFFLQPESLSFPYTTTGEKFMGIVNARREAKLYETAYCFLERKPGIELLLIDGPLAFSNLWSMTGLERDRQRLIDAIIRLLDFCKYEKVTVAGVVKRPSARYLVYHLGLQEETDLPDAFLLLQTLRAGERTDIFSPRRALKRGFRSSAFMDAIGYPIYSFYGRFSREWSIPPIRVDLPAFSLGYLEDIADYCYDSSYWRGIPLPIVRADEEVRISKRFIGEVYSDIVRRIIRRTGEVSHLAPYWGEWKWMGV